MPKFLLCNKKILNTLLLVFFAITSLSVPVFTQQSTFNPINFSIPKVTKDGKDEPTKLVALNSWKYDGDLSLNDSIKYSWSTVDLDVIYKTKPAKNAGYLKIYLDDDSKPENFILDYGASPITLSKLASKLKEGDTKLLFNYIDSNGKVASKVVFSFKFKNATTDPQIKVLQPAEGSVFAKGIDQDFVLQLKNFTLEANNSNNANRGKLNIYFNEVNQTPNLIGTLSISKDSGENQAEVKFSSKDIDFSKAKIPDSTQTKLIFVLTKTNGDLLPFRTELKAQTNYDNSLVLNYPRVAIIEPRKDRTDLQIDADRKFVLQIDNFEILPERKDGPNEGKIGYLQIFVDDVPRKTIFANTEFTLNDIGISGLTEGRKTIKVQLVNKDFTKLTPEAKDTTDIIYAPKNSEKSNENTPQVENNTWRIVIVTLTVILVIGGIAILITKG